MVSVLLSMATPAFGFLPPPPPPPPPPPIGGPGGAVGGGGTGGAVVGAWVAYVARGMVGVVVIGATEKREANACEFLTWPLHQGCAMSAREAYEARVRYAYSQLPAHKEQLFFNRTASYPSVAQMVRALRKVDVVVR